MEMGSFLKWTDMSVYRLNQGMLNAAKEKDDSIPEIFESLLFDVTQDAGQLHPINNPELEQKMRQALRQTMAEHDVPEEQYQLLGL